MKKLLLILVAIPLFAMGQRDRIVKEYCFIYFTADKTAKVVKSDSEPPYKELRDSTGNKVKFNNHVHLLEYMSQKGWEYIPEYIREQGGHLFYRIKKSQREGAE